MTRLCRSRRYGTDVTTLDLHQDAPTLTAALVDVYSESGHETELADLVERALLSLSHLDVTRDGDAIVARTENGRRERVVLAGHLDTVPPGDNIPSRREGDVLYGLGSADMKSGIAVMLRLAATVDSQSRDVTYVFYDGEEVEAERNGLLRLSKKTPAVLHGDFAVLLEPTDAIVEGGCQGTMRIDVTLGGVRAHSARSWMGDNAIHAAAPVLELLRQYQPRSPQIDGLHYREGLNAVGIHGGVAGNVIPDSCVVTVNYRFAPDRSEVDAEAHLREVFDGFAVSVTDSAPGARAGLEHRAARSFVDAVGGQPRAKFGWTDVAQFSQLGIPAVNFGPGDPNVAHTRGEWVSATQIIDCEERLTRWLIA
jgi:succinyl-diaminopimelate desuccinylase